MCRHASFEAFDDDPRLGLLRPEWFAGRAMLDVGCNEGLVTLAVAARYGCDSATGVDIDRVLIGKACRNLRTLRSQIAEQMRLSGAGAAASGGSGGSGGLHRLSHAGQGAQEPAHALWPAKQREQGSGAADQSSVRQEPQASQQSAQQSVPQPSTEAAVQVQQPLAELPRPQPQHQHMHGEQLPHPGQHSQPSQQQEQRLLSQPQLQPQLQQEAEQEAQNQPQATQHQLQATHQAAKLKCTSSTQQASDQAQGGGSQAVAPGNKPAGGQPQARVALPLPRTLMPPPERPSKVPWNQLRTAARALSKVSFIGMDWANEDMPGGKGKGGKGGGTHLGGEEQLEDIGVGAQGAPGGAQIQGGGGCDDCCTSARTALNVQQSQLGAVGGVPAPAAAHNATAAAAAASAGGDQHPHNAQTVAPSAIQPSDNNQPVLAAAHQQQPSSSGPAQPSSLGGGAHGTSGCGASARQLRVPRRFGVIMCLSVTKWVHINWGDEGLMRLFHKFWSHLEPGEGHSFLHSPCRSDTLTFD